MNNTVLEITDQEYLIKLNKQEFDISFIQSLLKRIQSEKTFFNRIFNEEDGLYARSLAFEDRDVDHLSEK